jgi:hypothetical protein
VWWPTRGLRRRVATLSDCTDRDRALMMPASPAAIFTHNPEDVPLAFQADYAGSILVTRSTENPRTARVFTRPRPPRASEIRVLLKRGSWVPSGDVRTTRSRHDPPGKLARQHGQGQPAGALRSTGLPTHARRRRPPVTS